MTKPVDTELARRRRMAKPTTATSLASQPASVPVPVFVEPPLAQVLGQVKAVVATELAFMAADQRSGARMEQGDAKKLQALTTALANAVGITKALDEDDLSALTPDELISMLESEVAARREAGRRAEGATE